MMNTKIVTREEALREAVVALREKARSTRYAKPLGTRYGSKMYEQAMQRHAVHADRLEAAASALAAELAEAR